jgi:hypothetical protein
VLKSYNPPFSRFVEGGYWKLAKATCTDLVGNTRYLGPNELGNAVFYIDNPLVSVEPPKYEPGSISIQATPVTVDGRAFDRVTATWRMLPHVVDFASFSATLSNLDGGGGRIYAQYTLYDNATRTATVKFDVPDYFQSGHYAITDFQMYDAAGNRIVQFFPDPVTNEQPKSVNLIHPNGDSGAPPELDLNRITVAATPTQPAAPNGETTVKVAFYARDDLSGLSNLRISLLNPQGEVMPYYFYVALTGSNALLVGTDGTKTPFAGDPGTWQRYEATIVLPAGSVPGTWGIRDMHLSDKAGFGKIYDFAEVLHFVVSAN